MKEKVEISELLSDAEFSLLPIIATRAINATKTNSGEVFIDISDLLAELQGYHSLNQLYANGIQQV